MKNLNKTTLYVAFATLLIGLLLGWVFFGRGDGESEGQQTVNKLENTTWTCSMHPQIRQSEPGQCPICGMDLIPLNNESSSDENPMEIKMSPTAMQLANIQTSVIKKQKPIKEVRMNGKVKADERRVVSQSSHIPGRIEKLMVSFTGESVQKGQILAYVYSPELHTAQEELFQANKIKESQPELFQAARDKLKNWKLTDAQIDEIIEKNTIQELFPIRSDVAGIVLTKKINLGDYISKGQAIYEIVNLSTVWVLFDVYESDIAWVKLGDRVKFNVQSLPGENFTGKVSFIDPVINPKTRVASARIEKSNPGMRLKPEMFAQGIVESPLQNQKEALIVPKTAVMWTGERSVVYVKNSQAEGVSFMMRRVTLGPALGDSYVIVEGLKEGEEIATNGTFSIDAAAQLAGKPSMMNPEGGVISTGHNHGKENNPKPTEQGSRFQEIKVSKRAKAELKPLFDNYFVLKDALVADDFEKAKSETREMALVLSKINMGVFVGEAQNLWVQQSALLDKELKKAGAAKDIEILRGSFKPISSQMITIVQAVGAMEVPIFLEFCPMADNNKGADWLSTEYEIRNPYFGNKMLKCGKVKQTFKSRSVQSAPTAKSGQNH